MLVWLAGKGISPRSPFKHDPHLDRVPVKYGDLIGSPHLPKSVETKASQPLVSDTFALLRPAGI